MSMKLKRLPSLGFYKAWFTLPQAVRHCSCLSSSNQAGCAQLCIWSIVSEFFCIENRLSHDLRGGVTLKELDDLLYLYRNVVSCLPDGLVCKLAHFWHESIHLQGDFLETASPQKIKPMWYQYCHLVQALTIAVVFPRGALHFSSTEWVIQKLLMEQIL